MSYPDGDTAMTSATFSFRQTVLSSYAPYPPRTGVADHPRLSMATLNTYIVEDSPVILENLVATLEELASVKVIGSAPDEAAAVRWLSEPGPHCDLMIIDVFLKSGSGLGVLRAAARAPQSVKRVVLTNYATPDMRNKCRELGADRVFDKSSELEDLIGYCSALANGADTTPSALS